MEQERRYDFSLRWSEEDAAFLATCSSFPDLSAFGSTPEEALAEARVVLEMLIEEYRDEGVPLPEPHSYTPHSGQVRLRMPKSLHRSLAERAEREGVSLNTLMVSVLSASGTWPAPQQDSQSVFAQDRPSQVTDS